MRISVVANHGLNGIGSVVGLLLFGDNFAPRTNKAHYDEWGTEFSIILQMAVPELLM